MKVRSGIRTRTPWFVVLATCLLVTSCAESPTQPRSTQSDRLGTSGAELFIAARKQAVEIDVDVRADVKGADGRLHTLGSHATYRSKVAVGARLVTLPAFAPNSEIAEGFKGVAAAVPELASLIASRKLDQQIEISQPARSATVLCVDNRAWRRSAETHARSVVVTEGTGDSPALRTSIIRDGRVVMIQERKWTRLTSAWVLTELTTRRPDDSYVQRTTVRVGAAADSTASFPEASAEVVRVKCKPEQLSARSEMSVRSAPSVPTAPSSFGTDTAAPVAYDCGDSPGCVVEQQTWSDAVADVVDAHITSTAVCFAVMFTPPPFTPAVIAACVAALYHESLMVYRAERARNAYWGCMARQNLQPQRVLAPQVSKTSAVGNGSLFAVALSAVQESVAADCGDPGSGGGSGGGGGPVFSCRTEMWEISYDGGDTWSPIQVTVCEML